MVCQAILTHFSYYENNKNTSPFLAYLNYLLYLCTLIHKSPYGAVQK